MNDGMPQDKGGLNQGDVLVEMIKRRFLGWLPGEKMGRGEVEEAIREIRERTGLSEGMVCEAVVRALKGWQLRTDKMVAEFREFWGVAMGEADIEDGGRCNSTGGYIPRGAMMEELDPRPLVIGEVVWWRLAEEDPWEKAVVLFPPDRQGECSISLVEGVRVLTAHVKNIKRQEPPGLGGR